MIRFFYRTQAGSFVEFTDRVNLSEQNVVLTTEAEQGKVGSTTIVVDDPDGDWNIGGHRHVFVEEDEATWIRVWAGYTAEREIIRGPYRTGVSRQWKLTLVDLNSVVARRIFTEEDADRPAETDVERLTWLLSTPEASLIDDDTYFSTANPVNMSAANYIGQRLIDVIDDCAQSSGKNWHLVVIFDVTFLFSFWYDFSESAEFVSDLRISNVIADVDNSTTWYASLDTTLTRSPLRVYSGGYANYDGGAVYRERAATETAFALGGRDTVLSWPNVKTEAAALARTDRELVVISTEEDIIKTSIEVPPEHVNDVIAGQRLEAKFIHMQPWYHIFTWFRVVTLTPTLLTPKRYKLDLTLSPIVESVAPACATQVAAMTAWDSGAIVGTAFPTVSVSPAPPIDFPSVAVVGWIGRNAADAMGDVAPTLANYTVLGHSRPGSPPPTYSSLTMVGYKALALGTLPNYTVGWESSGAVQAYRALAVYIQTSATAPVQTAEQMDTGNSATFPGTPTVGNIIVGFHSCEGNPVTVVTGWTLVDTVEIPVGIGGMELQAWARCVQPGDDETYLVSEEGFSHWAFLSEWAIT